MTNAPTGRKNVLHSCRTEYNREGPGRPADVNQTRTLVERSSRPSGRLMHGGGKSVRLVDQGVPPVDLPRLASPSAPFIISTFTSMELLSLKRLFYGHELRNMYQMGRRNGL